MTAPHLPTPGSDDGTWGDLLNQFLLVEHNADGTLANVARPADVAAVTVTETAVKTSAYTAAGGQLVPVDTTSGAVIITLPAATAGLMVGVRFDAGTHALAIDAAGTDKIGVGTDNAVTDMVLGETRTWRAVAGRWHTVSAFKPGATSTIGGASDFDSTGTAVGMSVAVTQVTGGVPTKFGLIAAVPTMLINTTADLPAGTPAGTVVVVKS